MAVLVGSNQSIWLRDRGIRLEQKVSRALLRKEARDIKANLVEFKKRQSPEHAEMAPRLLG
jgi:hypothetical protein